MSWYKNGGTAGGGSVAVEDGESIRGGGTRTSADLRANVSRDCCGRDSNLLRLCLGAAAGPREGRLFGARSDVGRIWKILFDVVRDEAGVDEDHRNEAMWRGRDQQLQKYCPGFLCKWSLVGEVLSSAKNLAYSTTIFLSVPSRRN